MDGGLSTTETLLIAIAGGAVGVLLTGFAWVLVQVAAIPGDLERHDFEARILNEDLELWAADDYRELKRKLTDIEDRMASENRYLLYSQIYGRARATAKTEALHHWRDRLHEVERRLVAIKSKEGRRHRLIRHRKKYRHGLDLTAPAHVEPIIEEFRQPITKHGEPSIRVFDPTKFDLGDMLTAIERAPLEPEIAPRVERVSDGAGGQIETIHDAPARETPDVPGLSGPIEPDS